MRTEFLGPVDMAFFYVESQATPMNIGAVTIFEGKIDFDALINLVDTRIHQAPLYQQRVVEMPFRLGQPIWTFDPDFCVNNHVFKIDLEPPGTEEQLRRLIGHLVSGMLDRSKPLWEAYQIDGLSGNRTAIFFKVHHCMVDGLAAVELFKVLMDTTPEYHPQRRKPMYEAPPLPGASQQLIDAFRREVPHKIGVLNKLGHELAHFGSAFTDSDKRLKALIGVANLINSNLKPIRKLVINGTNTGHLTLAWSEFSLPEVRAIRATCSASVNDVMLCILGDAVEHYLTAHGDRSHQEFLRALVPVDIREEKERGNFGNRISVLPVDIPFGISDPLQRMERVAGYSRAMKQSSLALGLDIVLTLPSLSPPVTQPFVWRIAPQAFSLLAHTWCTNVAGPQMPMYMLGHQLLHSYGFFPLNPSMGLATVVNSYNERITMTLIADAGIIPDVLELKEYLDSAYLALRDAASVQAEPIADIKPSQEAVSTPEPEVANAPVPKADPPASEEMTVFVAQETSIEVQPKVEVELSAPADPKIPAEAVSGNGAMSPEGTSPLSGSPAKNMDVVLQEKPAIAIRPVSGPMKLFSEPWAQAYQEELNHSMAYYNASTRWEAGSLAFVLKPSPRHGYPLPSAVLLDLYRGKCRSARSSTVPEVMGSAAFVIEGDYDTWMKVLCGKAQPIMMLMLGRLHLRKGSMSRLVPFTQSAQELVHCAQHVS